VVRGSWFVVRGSWFVVRGPKKWDLSLVTCHLHADALDRSALLGRPLAARKLLNQIGHECILSIGEAKIL